MKNLERDRLVRRAVKRFGNNEDIVLRAKRSAIVARVGDVYIRNWFAGYRPNGRHPSLIKQDLAVALRIRVNDAFNRKPLSNSTLEKMLGLQPASVRSSLGYLKQVGMIRRRRPRQGWIIDQDYIAKQIDAPHFNRMVNGIIGGGIKLSRLKRH